jgi:uncharacterized protein with von Willebrand factor type A (vWA) domain
MKPNDYSKFIKPKSQPIDPESKQCFHTDKWDRRSLDRVYDELKEFVLANNKLNDKVPTGFEAMGDIFTAFLKPLYTLKDDSEIRPSFKINHAVMSEATTVKEFEELRQISIGDPIGAGLAATAIEPQLELMFEQFEESQKIADELEKLMQQMSGMQGDGEGEESDIDDLLAGEPGGEGGDSEAKNYQANTEAINAQMKMLEQLMEQLNSKLDSTIEKEMQTAKAIIAQGIKEALNNAGDISGFDGWGLGQGGLKKLPLGQRLEMAKKLASPKFRKMAEIIGKLQRAAIAAQHAKVINTEDEIHDVELGNDISRMLPLEMLYLNDPTMRAVWFNKFIEENLLQYALRGEEKVAKGGIILLEDGSGSMSGDREIWAKGIGLALLKIAMMQKRKFYAVHFGGSAEFKWFDYETDSTNLKLTTGDNNGNTTESTGMEAVFSYAETFFGGGTDFVTPLSIALAKLNAEFVSKGSVEADIVFLTDGACGVAPEFLETFKAEQERLGFRVFGISIGGHVDSEPMATICDKNVITTTNITDATDVKDLFKAI